MQLSSTSNHSQLVHQRINNLSGDKMATVPENSETEDLKSHILLVEELECHSPSTNSNKKLKTNHSLTVMPAQGPGSIKSPAPLPALTKELEEIRSGIGMVQGQKSFIYLWASNLLKSTNGLPTKKDYLNYASNIVATYPELGGGANGCGIVRYQLSTNVRNRRVNSKKAIAKMKSCGSPLIKTNSAVVIPQHSSTIDDQDALKELEKSSNRTDSPHVRQLMRATLSIRRQWIDKEPNITITDIIARYPHMKLPNLVEFEFSMLIKVEREEIYSKIDETLGQLVKYFVIEEKNEKAKADILVMLWNTLTAKTQKKTCTPLFILKEQMDSTMDLLSSKTASPRVVLYTAEGGIAAAFIVAEENIRMKIEEPTVTKIVACLLASYFAWNTAYPPAYVNTMEYIESQVVRSVTKLRPAVEKFIRNKDLKLRSES